MNKKLQIKLLLLSTINFLFLLGTFAQDCRERSEFTSVCIGNDLSFPAGDSSNSTNTDVTDILPSNNYGCLSSARYGRWFYFEASTAGSLNINQTNSNDEDVNGALWGPFDSIDDMTAQCNNYPEPLDCDWTTSTGFNFSITAEEGKFYALLVANFSGNPTDITLSDGGSTATTNCAPNVYVEKSSTTEYVEEGSTIDWILEVTNDGLSTATGVTITDLLPSGVTFASGTGNGTYNETTGLWTVGDLAVGETKTLTISSIVNNVTTPCTDGLEITNTITNLSLNKEESDITPDILEATVPFTPLLSSSEESQDLGCQTENYSPTPPEFSVTDTNNPNAEATVTGGDVIVNGNTRTQTWVATYQSTCAVTMKEVEFTWGIQPNLSINATDYCASIFDKTIDLQSNNPDAVFTVINHGNSFCGGCPKVIDPLNYNVGYASEATFVVTDPNTGCFVTETIILDCDLLLPVEFLMLNVQVSDNENLVSWSTASENNNDFFTVEVSLDGMNYEQIGTVNGSGSSTNENNYSFTDKK